MNRHLCYNPNVSYFYLFQRKTKLRTITLACVKLTQTNPDNSMQASFPRHFRRKCMYTL